MAPQAASSIEDIDPQILTELVFSIAQRGSRASIERSIDMSRITMQGRDWTQPDASTAWQRERADPPLAPLEAEFSGPRGLATWATIIAVTTLFWAAVFCWWLG